MLTKHSPLTSLRVTLLVLAASFCAMAANITNAQKSFSSGEDAAQALVAAAQANDDAALVLLFGPVGKQILSTGDPAQDKNYRAAFVAKAKASTKLEKDPMNANRLLVTIGEDRFPFAIPLKRTADGQWMFDVEEGKVEMQARRIGSNELDAIAVCSGFLEAQFEYSEEAHDKDDVPVYAQKFVSSPGKRDGLYWPPSSGSKSPLSSRVKDADAVRDAKGDEKPTPYHGYFFKILKGQGPKAPGGAKEYVEQGLMIGGFALIAWPAEYGVSGIKTFMVNQDGVIYDRDLGPATAKAAQAITKFNPDNNWRPLR